VNLENLIQKSKLFEFLEKIKHIDDKDYKWIDKLYVSPIEYEGIEEVLNKKRIVFITGTQEFGKTYTAVRLLWVYYNRGYEPIWYEYIEEEEMGKPDVGKKLEKIRRNLISRHILYFEDPFGKTKYRTRESLEREIGTIIDAITQVKDVYVIITSREEVFKEFEKENISVKKLEKFEKKLNIKKPSYNYEKRRLILQMWTEEERCIWLWNDELKRMVFKYLRHNKYLPTPLSMRSFAAVTKNICLKNELEKKIIEKSEETAKAFAKEIKNMTADKILFLSFLFIYNGFKVSFIKLMYEELLIDLRIENAMSFNELTIWFEKDKLRITRKHIRFSHPSYTEAFNYLVYDSKFYNYFFKVFIKLLKTKEYEKFLSIYIVKKIPKDLRDQILLILSKKVDFTEYVKAILIIHFKEFSGNVRNEILYRLSERIESADSIAIFLKDNFKDLSGNVRNKILFRLSMLNKTAKYVNLIIKKYFHELPPNVRNKILINLSEKDKISYDVMLTLIKYFHELPPNVRNKILINLSEKDKIVPENEFCLDILNKINKNEL